MPESPHKKSIDAEKLTEEFKDYAYSVSHDQGAPVRAIVEFSKLLNLHHAEALNEEGKEYLSILLSRTWAASRGVV